MEGSWEMRHWHEEKWRSIELLKDDCMIMERKNRYVEEKVRFSGTISLSRQEGLKCNAWEEWLPLDGSTNCLSPILEGKQITCV